MRLYGISFAKLEILMLSDFAGSREKSYRERVPCHMEFKPGSIFVAKHAGLHTSPADRK